MLTTVHAREIPYLDPLVAYQPWAQKPWSLFLDSALPGERLGRYSFIAADPFLTLTSKGRQIRLGDKEIQGNPFEVLQTQLVKYPLAYREGFPRFQTGLAGYFGYDLGHHLETLPGPGADDMGFPDLMLGFYDVVIAFDQVQKRAWIMSSGYPAEKDLDRALRAQERMQTFLKVLDSTSRKVEPPFRPAQKAEIRSNFERSAYEEAVARVVEYIYAGDIFQANLSQRFSAPLPEGDTPFDLYKRLRAINPAPFAAFMNFGETVIASASPERFLLLRDGWVETRPIKGTRPRGSTPEADRALAHELLESEKDRAENVMIVDLLRNDLSRVCQDHTVKAPEICVLESYATVHHLVSTVEGRLNPEADAVDLLCATIPGGSITGAPKIRAMEIIAELEPTWRGPYCGNIGYLSFTGDMDTNIVIRTYALRGKQVTFQAGGGIVADSEPVREYEETLDKARALIDALGPGEVQPKSEPGEEAP
jgi:para-aminobenzoate synthetase component 1